MRSKFHLSFSVLNLQGIRSFYAEALGCDILQETTQWIEFGFFDHSITIHQSATAEAVRRPDHFGVIVSKKEWITILKRIGGAAVRPKIYNEGENNEHGKLFLKDPANNIIELKYAQTNLLDWFKMLFKKLM